MLELIKVKYDQDIKKQLEKRFIAFDVETTGLNPKEERIIELGAVLFENGQAVQKFNTLVNAEVEVSEFISNLTHIRKSTTRRKSIRDVPRVYERGS